jgi:hypothetical protein
VRRPRAVGPVDARRLGVLPSDEPGCACDAGSKAPTDASLDAPADAGSSPTPAFPVGVYTSCSSGVVEGSATAGGELGGMTLTESDGVVTATFDDLFAVGGTLSFTALTDRAAIIVPGQAYDTFNVACATSTVSAGALTLDGDALVLTLLGEGCQDAIAGGVSCIVPAQPTSPPGTAASNPPAFPVGVYGQCTGSLPEYGGGLGDITLTKSHGVLTASFGDAGTNLEFTPTSEGAATVVPGQTWVELAYPCMTHGLPVPVSTTVTLTSGSLVYDAQTLFLDLVGTDDCEVEVDQAYHCTLGF